jgi:hypothetical protein
LFEAGKGQNLRTLITKIPASAVLVFQIPFSQKYVSVFMPDGRHVTASDSVEKFFLLDCKLISSCMCHYELHGVTRCGSKPSDYYNMMP